MNSLATKTNENKSALSLGDHKFKNKNCEQLCNRIVAEYKKENTAIINIGKALTEIKAKKLYEVEGFDKFSDFCTNVIGLQSAQTARYMSVYKSCTVKGALPEKLEGFSSTALVAIAGKADSPEKAVEIVTSQGLTPTMSVSQIKEKIKDLDTAKGKTSKAATPPDPYDFNATFDKIKTSGVFTDKALFNQLPTDLITKIIKAIGEIKVEVKPAKVEEPKK